MKALAALEIRFLVEELQLLLGARVDRIFHPSQKELLVELYSASTKKALLRAALPYALYLASEKPSEPKQPSAFCLFLRKRLKNSRLKAFLQHSSERVVEMVFSSKNGDFRLVLELFSRGNIILCDASGTILAAAERQAWSTRKIAPKQPYALPPQKLDTFSLTVGKLQKALSESSRDSLVKALAADLGFGGVYAEEICLLSSVDKLSDPKKASPSDAEKIIKAISTLLKKKLQPVVVLKDGKPQDVVPFPLLHYKCLEEKLFRTYNEALDSVLTSAAFELLKEEKEAPAKRSTALLQRRISEQQEMVKNMARSIEENTKKGELIYEHYLEIKQLLADAKSKKPEELKKKHPLLNSVDGKTGKIIVELQ
ncbi:NFACT family protein [Candidatus Woesearchaeota archaeon]|nr:NFACT family protein [Candidatus Woesearchaeota archaeon]